MTIKLLRSFVSSLCLMVVALIFAPLLYASPPSPPRASLVRYDLNTHEIDVGGILHVHLMTQGIANTAFAQIIGNRPLHQTQSGVSVSAFSTLLPLGCLRPANPSIRLWAASMMGTYIHRPDVQSISTAPASGSAIGFRAALKA